MGSVKPDTERLCADPRLCGLTPREREILNLLASGHGTTEIATRLFISPVTVRNHIQRILAKLGVHGRIEAVLALWMSKMMQSHH